MVDRLTLLVKRFAQQSLEAAVVAVASGAPWAVKEAKRLHAAAEKTRAKIAKEIKRTVEGKTLRVQVGRG